VGAFFGARWLVAVAAGIPGAWLPFRRFDVPSGGAPRWARPAVAVAGPVAAYLLVSLLFIVSIKLAGETSFGTTVDVRPGSPAESAGMRAGDRVLRIEGQPVSTWDDVPRLIRERGGAGPLEVVVERGAAEVTFTVTPSVGVDGQPKIGVVASLPPRTTSIGTGTAIVRGLAGPAVIASESARAVARPAPSVTELSGPVGIVTTAPSSPAPDVLLLFATYMTYGVGLLIPLALVFALAGWRPAPANERQARNVKETSQ
jgi:regulator of sigma E protease